MDKKKKAIFQTIAPLRLMIYCTLFVCFLLGSLGYVFLEKKQAWKRVDEQIDRLIFLAQKTAQKEKERHKIKMHYKDTQSNYLQQQLCSYSLLEKEKKNITRVIHSPGFCGDKLLENRFTFLTSPLNAIKLQEQPLYTSSNFKEIGVTLIHPVEASLEDIDYILKKIEGEEKKKPLLVVSHFHLKRKKPVDHNEVFEVAFTILKREFLNL